MAKARPENETHDAALVRALLTTNSNKDVKPINAKAMPVILTTKEEYETWLTAPVEIMARGEKKDAA